MRKQTAIDICSKIVEAAVNENASKKLNINAYIDDNYVGTAVTPDTKLYRLTSRPEDYAGDYDHDEDVYVEDLMFPCFGLTFVGNPSSATVVFECCDPLNIGKKQFKTVGQIAQELSEFGIDNIESAGVRIDDCGTGKFTTCSIIKDFQPGSINLENNGGLVVYSVSFERPLNLSYTPTIDKLAQDKCNEELMYSESMKKLGTRYFGEEEKKFHEYGISYVTSISSTAKKAFVAGTSIEDAMKSFNDMIADEFPKKKVTKIINITCDGKMVSKKTLDDVNASLLDECDGGAAGGDAGGAPAGDAGAAAADAQTGDTAAEMVGTTTADVLGVCKPGEGYMGKDNFYIPAKAKVPLHRWEIANGGSKRKKNKKYDYEKGAKVVVSMFEDEMVNEFENKFSSYQWLNGKTWEEVVDEAGKHCPTYERWEAAQLPAPEENVHGRLSGCTIDEDKYEKAYLKQFFIHGLYKDGTMFELGPMKRKVASEYINLHKLSVNSRAFQQMTADGFSGIKEVGEYDESRPLHIGKLKDGFWLIDSQSNYKAGPFSNKQLARMYALSNNMKMEKGNGSDKTERGYELQYPTFSFSYTMAGVPCMDIVVAETLPLAMKRFDTQWRSFDGTRSFKDKFNTVQDLERDLSLLRIKDIEIEELNPSNIEEYTELAKETGNPSTIPELQKRCRNPHFRYFLGDEDRNSRLIIKPFTESI